MKRSRLNSDHTTQDRSKGYSLWLMPTGRVYSELTRLIFRLSREWSTDNFEPHVTLLGGLLDSEEAILSKTSQLAAWIRPYEIKLTTMDYLDEFFRCLFFRVETTESVMDANLKARNLFKRRRDPKHGPHLSLMYGNFGPPVKEKIIADIGCESNLRFKVRTIHVYSTTGKPRDWFRVREFTLK